MDFMETNEVLMDRNARLRKRIEELEQLATQRGARMQIMREWITNADWSWESFLLEHPDAADWFDADGVPVRKAREG